VPTIEIPPIRSGIAAAITPRNTSSSKIVSAGNAISSALVRSRRVWSLTSLKLGANPPIDTASAGEARTIGPIRRLASLAAVPPSFSTSCVARFAETTIERPSRSISGAPARGSRNGFTTWPTNFVCVSATASRSIVARVA
jgi:hypothetical protein